MIGPGGCMTNNPGQMNIPSLSHNGIAQTMPMAGARLHPSVRDNQPMGCKNWGVASHWIFLHLRCNYPERLRMLYHCTRALKSPKILSCFLMEWKSLSVKGSRRTPLWYSKSVVITYTLIIVTWWLCAIRMRMGIRSLSIPFGWPDGLAEKYALKINTSWS